MTHDSLREHRRLQNAYFERLFAASEAVEVHDKLEKVTFLHRKRVRWPFPLSSTPPIPLLLHAAEAEAAHARTADGSQMRLGLQRPPREVVEPLRTSPRLLL